jgi:hypothetical protein
MDDVDSAGQDDRWYGAGEYVDGVHGDTGRLINLTPAAAGDDDLVDPDHAGEEPIDLAAVHSDDVLLDALGGTNPETPARDDGRAPDLETLLVAWRRDVDAAPIGELVDIDRAVAAIAEGYRPSGQRRRHLIPLATAAAVLVIAFTGVGLAARDASPGDILWGVAQVLYTDHARVVQAATSARIELANANAAFLLGDRVAAEAALKRAQEQMQQVDAEHGLAELKSAQASLAAKVEGGDSSSASSSSSRPRGTSASPQPTPLSAEPAAPPVSTSSDAPSASLSPTASSSPPPSSSSSAPPSSTGRTGLFGGTTN